MFFLQKLKTNKKYNQPSFQLNNLHTTTLHMLTDIVSLYKPNRDVLGKIKTYPYPKSKKIESFLFSASLTSTTNTPFQYMYKNCMNDNERSSSIQLNTMNEWMDG